MSSVDEYGRDTCRGERSPSRRLRQERSPSCRRRSSSFRRASVVEGGFTPPQTHKDRSPHHGFRSCKVSPAPKLPEQAVADDLSVDESTNEDDDEYVEKGTSRAKKLKRIDVKNPHSASAT